jgi:hypothetical protein
MEQTTYMTSKSEFPIFLPAVRFPREWHLRRVHVIFIDTPRTPAGEEYELASTGPQHQRTQVMTADNWRDRKCILTTIGSLANEIYLQNRTPLQPLRSLLLKNSNALNFNIHVLRDIFNRNTTPRRFRISKSLQPSAKTPPKHI